MWAHARIELGLTDAEFWRLTLRQFQALDEAWMQREKREYGRAGIVAAMVGNYSMHAPKEPFKHTDFVPGWHEPELSEEELDEQIMKSLMPIAVRS